MLSIDNGDELEAGEEEVLPDPEVIIEETEEVIEENIVPTAGDISLNKAKLVKTEETSTVYLVNLQANEKRVIFNSDIFESRSYSWDVIETVQAQDLAVYTLTKPVLYPNESVLKFTDNKVYAVQNDYELTWIPSEEEFETEREWSDIKVLPDSLFASFEVVEQSGL